MPNENEGVVYAAEYSIPPSTKQNLNNLHPGFSEIISGLKVGCTRNPQKRFPGFVWGSGMNRVSYSCVRTLTPHLNEKKVHKMLTVDYPNAHIQGEWWKENAQMESYLNTTTCPSMGQGEVERGEFMNSRDSGILMTSIGRALEDSTWQINLVRN